MVVQKNIYIYVEYRGHKNLFVVFYCRPIHGICYSFVKIRSEVSTAAILKKQLQNRCRRHISGGQKVALKRLESVATAV